MSRAFDALNAPLIIILLIIAALIVLPLLYGLWTLAMEVFTTFQSGAAESDHWSPQTERLEVSSAPFRDAPLSRIKQRGAPPWLRVAGGLGVSMGVLTSCLLAPIALMYAHSPKFSQASQTLIILTALSGLAAGGRSCCPL